MSIRRLALSEITELQSILTKGISRMTYNMVAQYLIPLGFGWAQATGFARQLVPSFSGVDFASSWTKPYQVRRQTLDVDSRGKDELIPKKDMIHKGLKENTRYMYSVGFDVFDEEGEVGTTSHACFYSDERYTPEDVEFRAEQIWWGTSAKYPYGTGNYQFEIMYHNEGWDY